MADDAAQAGAGSRAGRVLARLAVAAAVALTLILPLTPAGRASPSARSFALLHERLETDRVLREGLIQANRFVHSYMSSVVTAEKGDRND